MELPAHLYQPVTPTLKFDYDYGMEDAVIPTGATA